MTMAAETPTIILVHGAWADATGFDAEIRALRERGYSVIGFGNPLRDLAGDAAYLAAFLRTLTGPIVLVGHSYGGNVISVATIGNPQVQALVYLNGWMCDVGESQQQLLEKFEGSLVGPSIRPVAFTNPDGSEGTDLYLAREAFRDAFAADVDPETAAVMAAAQRPYAAAAFAATPSDPPAWKTLPCWYLLGTEDKAIPPALQRFMAERANATIVEVPASHVSFVSQPEAAHAAHLAGRRRDSRDRLTSAPDDPRCRPCSPVEHRRDGRSILGSSNTEADTSGSPSPPTTTCANAGGTRSWIAGCCTPWVGKRPNRYRRTPWRGRSGAGPSRSGTSSSRSCAIASLSAKPTSADARRLASAGAHGVVLAVASRYPNVGDNVRSACP